MTRTPLLTVENLQTEYVTGTGRVRAVDSVSFVVDPGESLGIAGESGCGKSTVALSLIRLVRGGAITGGRIVFGDRSVLDLSAEELRRFRWERIALVPQAAMGALNPVYRIGDQIVEALAAHRSLAKPEAWARAIDLLRRVRIEPAWAWRYPHELSGGMRQRAVIAMALALDPDLLVADEPTTALDVFTQAQIIKLLGDLRRKLGLSLIWISHDLSVLAHACDRILIMYAGRVVETGSVRVLFRTPRHPYTRALLQAFPDVRDAGRTLTGLPGSPPDLRHPPAACRFRPRCPLAADVCEANAPPTIEVGRSHYVTCHFPL